MNSTWVKVLKYLIINVFKYQKCKVTVFLFKMRYYGSDAAWSLQYSSDFVTSHGCIQPLRLQGRWGKRKRWETGRKRGRKSVRKRERERRRHRQTVWLHRDLQHSASYDSEVRGYPHWWISGRVSSPSQKKGSCFHSLSLESLFQESVLPTRDCKPVSRQKSYVHKYYTFFFFFKRFYWPAKTSRDAPFHSNASMGVITEQWE